MRSNGAAVGFQEGINLNAHPVMVFDDRHGFEQPLATAENRRLLPDSISVGDTWRGQV